MKKIALGFLFFSSFTLDASTGTFLGVADRTTQLAKACIEPLLGLSLPNVHLGSGLGGHYTQPDMALIQAAMARTYSSAEFRRWLGSASVKEVPFPQRKDGSALEKAQFLSDVFLYFFHWERATEQDVRRGLEGALQVSEYLERTRSLSPLCLDSQIFRPEPNDHLLDTAMPLVGNGYVGLWWQLSDPESMGVPAGYTFLERWTSKRAPNQRLKISGLRGRMPYAFRSLPGGETLGVFSAASGTFGLELVRLSSEFSIVQRAKLDPGFSSAATPFVELSPKGDWLAVARNGFPPLLVNSLTLKSKSAGLSGEWHHAGIQFSPDGKKLFAFTLANPPLLRVYEVPSLNLVHTQALSEPARSRNAVDEGVSPAWADYSSALEGRFWLFADGAELSVPLFDAKTHALSQLNPRPTSVLAATVSVAGHPSQPEAVTLDSLGMLHFWNLTTHEEVRQVSIPAMMDVWIQDGDLPMQSPAANPQRVFYSDKGNYILVTSEVGGVSLFTRRGEFLELLYSRVMEGYLAEHRVSMTEATGTVLEMTPQMVARYKVKIPKTVLLGPTPRAIKP